MEEGDGQWAAELVVHIRIPRDLDLRNLTTSRGPGG